MKRAGTTKKLSPSKMTDVQINAELFQLNEQWREGLQSSQAMNRMVKLETEKNIRQKLNIECQNCGRSVPRFSTCPCGERPCGGAR